MKETSEGIMNGYQKRIESKKRQIKKKCIETA